VKTLKEIIVGMLVRYDKLAEFNHSDFADNIVDEFMHQPGMTECQEPLNVKTIKPCQHFGTLTCRDCCFKDDCILKQQQLEPIEKSFQPCGVVYAENFFSMYSAICLINNKLNEVIDRVNKMEKTNDR
jgi:hypothetical protein